MIEHHLIKYAIKISLYCYFKNSCNMTCPKNDPLSMGLCDLSVKSSNVFNVLYIPMHIACLPAVAEGIAALQAHSCSVESPI